MKKLFLLFCLPIILAGCVPAALVIGATAGGAVIYDKRSMKTIVQDQESAHAAAKALNSAPSLHKSHLVVAVFNHILLLTGQTATIEQRKTAEQLVSHIANISRVYNEVTIGKSTSLWRRSKDAWITAEVKSAMLAKKGLESTQIKVVTENATVFLMGIITHEQAEMAANVARRIKGVHKVVKVFQYPQ